MKSDNFYNKNIWGWAIYDWANSAFATSVIAGFFPIFFKTYWAEGADINTSTAQLGFGNALASLIIAILGPLLGAIGDRASALKRFMLFFAYMGVLMTGGLFFINRGEWLLAILLYILGLIGFSGANIFYDALLPNICTARERDYVSSLGYSLGYLGGGILFLINVIMVMKPEIFGLVDKADAIRYCFLTVAIWWGIFTIFPVIWIKEPNNDGRVVTTSKIIPGFKQLIDTIKKIKQLKMTLLFLIAYWLYIDGVDTIIRMSVDYGLSLGFKSSDLILALLLVQFVGFPSALVFGKLAKRWDAKRLIQIAIYSYMFITLWGVFMNKKYEFYILALLIALFQGGIQALSRSYYSRLIPVDQSGEFYGFYNMLGKFAAIIGPAMVGFVGMSVKSYIISMSDALTHHEISAIGHFASRAGIASIIFLFIGGGIILSFVDEKQARSEIDRFLQN